MLSGLTLLIGLVVAPATLAQIYKYKDKDGNVVFSDKPPSEEDGLSVEQVELNSTNRAEPPPQVKARTPANDSNSAPEISYETVITSPSDGSTIPMGPGNFAVTASFAPALAATERVQLLVDGEVTGAPQRAAAWRLENIFRGEHSLVVQRLGRGGKVLHSSAPVTVYVMRPSIR